MPSSTTYSAISVAIRRTISSRCATAETSRTVTRSSISSAESVPATSSSRSLYRSRVASAWLARDRIAAESSRTRRCPSTYSAISRIDWLTETTGKPVWMETRCAVRCRVPVSSVGIVGVGDQLHARPHDLGDVPVEDQRAVELAQLAQPGRGELDVQDEAAGAQRLDGPVHAEDDEPAGVAAEDPLQAVTQGRAGRDRAQ